MAKPESRPEGRKAQPISRHPLFPAIVALWFAALFGLGSLMVSPALIERIVSATGLAKVLPMAAPPLGATARILFALALTGLGGLVGLVAGRRVAQTGEDAPARMPFAGIEAGDTAPEEIGEPEAEPAELRVSAALPRRRRALALPAEDTPSLDEPEIAAPEAEQPPILNLSELDLEDVEADGLAESLSAVDDAYHQPDLEESSVGSLEPPETVSAEWSPAEDEAPAPQPAVSIADDEQGPFGRIPEWLEPRQDVHSFSPARWGAAQEEVSRPEAPAPENLSNRLFEAYSRALSEPAEAPNARPLFSAPVADADANLIADAATSEERLQAAERIAGADLEDLSQVELLERLALAMERQRRLRAAAAAAAAIKTEAEAEDQAGSDDAAIVADPTPPSAGTIASPPERAIDSLLPRLASVSPFTPPLRSVPDPQDLDRDDSAPVATVEVPTPIPAALRPIGFDAFGHDEADDALPGYIPPRHISLALANPVAALPQAPAEDMAEADDEAEDHGRYAAFNTLADRFDYDEAPEDDGEEMVLAKGYSSLLSLSRQSPRQNFVRLGEDIPAEGTDEPVSDGNGTRPFDPPARLDPGETEKALRAALVTLQRMSGAA